MDELVHPASGLAGFHGLLLRQVTLLEWRAARDLADGMVAVEFSFDNTQFVIANALDENTIEIGRAGRRIPRPPPDAASHTKLTVS